MTLLFGTNQTWNVADAKELSVQLDNRIVLTPFAAKRLLTFAERANRRLRTTFFDTDAPEARGFPWKP